MEAIIHNIIHITSYCDCNTIFQLMFVSKLFHDRIRTRLFWKQLIIEKYKFDVDRVTIDTKYIYYLYLGLRWHVEQTYYTRCIMDKVKIAMSSLGACDKQNNYFKGWVIRYKYNMYETEVDGPIILLDSFMNLLQHQHSTWKPSYIDVLNNIREMMQYAPLFMEKYVFKYGLLHFRGRKQMLSLELQQQLPQLFSLAASGRIKRFVMGLDEWALSVRRELVIELAINFFYQKWISCNKIIGYAFPQPRTEEDSSLVIELVNNAFASGKGG